MKKKSLNLNKLINFKIIKLISFKSKLIGIFKFSDFIINSKLNIVQVYSKNNVSICKILNRNKFLYIRSKKFKKKNNFKKTKEIKIYLFISKNDYINKLKKIKNFLNRGLKVKINLNVKGREITKIYIISEKINKLIKDLLNYGLLINRPNDKLNNIFLFFNPIKKIK